MPIGIYNHPPQCGFQKGHKINLGRKYSEEFCKKISEIRKGMPNGRHTIRCVSCVNRSGENNPNWQGGKSFEPYGLEFNNQLKEQIRKRDNYVCQECGHCQDKLGYKLYVHHIDYDKKNNNPNNLISLCRTCHLQTNYKRENWTNYFKEKLYVRVI